jgi:Holliday junction resolvase RusA-like endonuclease
MKWSFMIDMSNVSDRDFCKTVEEKAKESVSTIGKPKASSVFKASITFFQGKDRWQKDNPQIPREDVGRDLDNLIKPIFDSLGPIVGYRKTWKKTDTGKWVVAGRGTAADSKIVELTAKKVNSGSRQEYLGIEIENVVG